MLLPAMGTLITSPTKRARQTAPIHQVCQELHFQMWPPMAPGIVQSVSKQVLTLEACLEESEIGLRAVVGSRCASWAALEF